MTTTHSTGTRRGFLRTLLLGAAAPLVADPGAPQPPREVLSRRRTVAVTGNDWHQVNDSQRLIQLVRKLGGEEWANAMLHDVTQPWQDQYVFALNLVSPDWPEVPKWEVQKRWMLCCNREGEWSLVE